MKKSILIALLVLCAAMHVYAADGLVNVPSIFSVEKTADRIESILNEKGITIFNRIKHSEGANKIGIELRDTELIIFGNPKIGSPLMQCQQSVAIDLPQKVLIWEDENAKVWISYTDPRFLKERHNITGCEEIILKIEKVLAGIAKTASTE
jgi:uncharacterized protein (DUF302 family)